MKGQNQTVSLLLIPVLVLYTMAYLAAPLFVNAEESTITQFTPETVESEPVEPPKTEGKGVSKWWYVLGLAVIGGAVAASSDGGGGGGGGGGDGSSSTGTIDTSW